jgi:hypothetical protein
MICGDALLVLELKLCWGSWADFVKPTRSDGSSLYFRDNAMQLRFILIPSRS